MHSLAGVGWDANRAVLTFDMKLFLTTHIVSSLKVRERS